MPARLAAIVARGLQRSSTGQTAWLYIAHTVHSRSPGPIVVLWMAEDDAQWGRSAAARRRTGRRKCCGAAGKGGVGAGEGNGPPPRSIRLLGWSAETLPLPLP